MSSKSPYDNSLPKRGTTSHLANKYFKLNHLPFDKDYGVHSSEPETLNDTTKVVEVKARSMINKVKSPDLFMDYSINPYQGCEHGCVYCYARPTHNYWGYSAADDFERIVLAKTNALNVLKTELCQKNYQVKPLMLSGNTDCYQPIERKYKITRSILELCHQWKHPVQIITKNALILRDLDLLISLNKKQLCSVAISLTSFDDSLRRVLEPRASSIASRFKTIKELCQHKIPVHIMMAPIIPGLNDIEIFKILEHSSKLGANSASYQIVRLNGDLQEIFNTFLDKQFPNQKNKIINAIKSCHNDRLSDSRFGLRMKGEGNVAEMIRQQFHLAYNKYFPKSIKTKLRTDLYNPIKNGQMSLW